MRLRILYLTLCSGLLLLGNGCGSSSDGNSTTPPPTTSHFAYVSNSDSSNITAYKMDSASGALTAIAGSPFGGVDAPLGLALSADLLAVGNLNAGGISVFRVNKTSGAITAVAGSPFPTTGGGFPARSLFHPSGKFLYTGLMLNATSDISGFSVDSASGSLTPLAGSPFPGQTLGAEEEWNHSRSILPALFFTQAGSLWALPATRSTRPAASLHNLRDRPLLPPGRFSIPRWSSIPRANFSTWQILTWMESGSFRSTPTVHSEQRSRALLFCPAPVQGT